MGIQMGWTCGILFMYQHALNSCFIDKKKTKIEIIVLSPKYLIVLNFSWCAI